MAFTLNLARNQCRGLGGDLASFATLEENNAVKSLIEQVLPEETSREFWIGLGDTREGWEWTDGSPVVFLHWGRFQPNLFDGNNAGTEIIIF